MSADSSTAPSRRRRSRSRNQKTARTIPQAGTRPATELRNLWIYAALVITVIGIYAQVRNFDFVNYDDPEYVTGNAHVRQGLTPQNLVWAATSREAANWFPVTRISHMLDVQMFRLDAGLHHLTNVLFHALTTLLVFAFLYRATHARWPSAFVAAIFAAHPLHVESVAWIAERKDVLSAFFWFLALLAYVAYVQRPGMGRYFAIVLAFCAGLLSKPMVVTLPLVLLLLDVWPLQRLPANKTRTKLILLEKLPFLTLAAVAGVITYFAQQASRAIKPFPIGLRLENALVSYATYLARTFWPARLAVFYPYPHDFPGWEVVLAGVLVSGVTVLALLTYRNRPYLGVGWSWYLITLLPVIGIVQVGTQARADRYTYLPMIGLLIMISWSAADAVKAWPRAKPVVAALGAAAFGCCAILAFLQIQYWRNSESLFKHALEVTHGNYVAHHNFGLAIADLPGRLPEAISHYQAALAIQPESVEARTDLGTALAKSGDFKEAIDEYHTALRIAPDCTICRNNLKLAQNQWADELFQSGVALAKDGKTREAIEQFEAALRLEPDYPEAHNNLGVALGTLRRTEEAIQEFKAAIRLKPDYEDARYNLAAALKQLRQ
jgi:protein O-mannosyl-transferase